MSYANFPASVVIQACESYLESRQARIERECEQVIAHWTGAKIWFWGKPLTREQAEDYCSDELFNIRITGGAWAQQVEALLSLAKISEKSNTAVTVKAELAPLLEKHFK